MPVVLLLMPLSWLLLTKVLFREQIQKIAGGREWIRTELKNIGKPTRGEISVLIVFICAVVLWCLGSQIRSFTLENGVRPFRMVSDAVIAMAAGVSLFCIPVNFSRGERALDWKHCDNIPGTCFSFSEAAFLWQLVFRQPALPTSSQPRQHPSLVCRLCS